jgi:hypothetical protein
LLVELRIDHNVIIQQSSLDGVMVTRVTSNDLLSVRFWVEASAFLFLLNFIFHFLHPPPMGHASSLFSSLYNDTVSFLPTTSGNNRPDVLCTVSLASYTVYDMMMLPPVHHVLSVPLELGAGTGTVLVPSRHPCDA